jgi:hypothetical protein
MSAKIVAFPKAGTGGTIKRAKLATIRMVGHGEKIIDKVILDGRVREWVGFGWIDIGAAEEKDYAKLPTVVD